LYKAYKLIENKYKIAWFIMFLILPMVLDLLIVLGVMNTLLEKGVLNKYWILGSPILVTVWTSIVILIYALTRKNIYKLTEK
jgi:membrane protein YdbS with pleckstrin-like domain